MGTGLQTQHGCMRRWGCISTAAWRGALVGPGGGAAALPSVLVLLLLYIFRRLPTRFSFQALRLAASREQKGERGKKRENKKEKKSNEKGRKETSK